MTTVALIDYGSGNLRSAEKALIRAADGTADIVVTSAPEDILGADFGDPKYGSYYRNLHGIVEHTHYHLGQIVLVKKIIQAQKQG
jgi:hypothetical protein